MKWRIKFSHSAEKFIDKNQITYKEILGVIKKALRYFAGEQININIGKLKGEWKGFYRIRMGRLRVIAEFNFEIAVVFIEEIDWRGNVYK
jgi:mRNA interferase RelE/StbE